MSPRDFISIKLSEPDFDLGMRLGHAKWEATRGMRDYAIAHRDSPRNNQVGELFEIAVRRWAGLPVVDTNMAFKSAPDVDIWEVRCAVRKIIFKPRPPWPIRMRDDKCLARHWIFGWQSSDGSRRFCIVGWRHGSDLLANTVIMDPGERGKPAPFIHWEKLYPMSTIPYRFDGSQRILL